MPGAENPRTLLSPPMEREEAEASMSPGAAVPTDPLGAFVMGPRLLEPGAAGGRLSGLRFAVKDVFDVAGTRTGAGNPTWVAEAPEAAAHAPAVAALLAGGADLWGKTVTDELAYSLSGTNVHYGTPRNAGAPGRVPGGSSSGSAAAVAGGAVELALGTDTGGSIRVPASYCGIYGLRTTHGRVPVDGVVPLAPSFDTVGLLAADPAHLATAWRALAAASPSVTSTAAATSTAPTATGPWTIRRLVVATDLMDLADAGAASALRAAAQVLGDRLGLQVVDRVLAGRGRLPDWRDAFRIIQQVEAWRCHGAWIDGREPDMGPGIEARFAAAKARDPADVERVLPVRAEVALAFERIMDADGLLVQPAAPGPAPPPVSAEASKEDLRVRTQALTAPAGLAGAPVVSLPLALVDHLPVGLAVVGRPGDDDALVTLAEAAAST